MPISDLIFRRSTGAAKCPGESAVLAYSEDRISASTRAQLERHFADCSSCRELVAFLTKESIETPGPESEEIVAPQTAKVLAMIRDQQRRRTVTKDKPVAGFNLSYFSLATAGVIVCLIAVGGVIFLTRQQSPADSAMAALKLATKDERRTEVRISGGLPYSRYAGVTRGGDSNLDDLQFSRASNKLKAVEQGNGSASERQMLARVYLAQGTRPDAQLALAILTKLAGDSVETPELLNDTGVAHFLEGDYETAASYFNRAFTKSPTYDEALFNKALAEQRLHRDQDAKTDWRRFLDQSSDEQWKSEAREFLKMLDRPDGR